MDRRPQGPEGRAADGRVRDGRGNRRHRPAPDLRERRSRRAGAARLFARAARPQCWWRMGNGDRLHRRVRSCWTAWTVRLHRPGVHHELDAARQRGRRNRQRGIHSRRHRSVGLAHPFPAGCTAPPGGLVHAAESRRDTGIRPFAPIGAARRDAEAFVQFARAHGDGIRADDRLDGLLLRDAELHANVHGHVPAACRRPRRSGRTRQPCWCSSP